MSEQQVLPEFLATLKAAAEKATPRHGFLDAKDGAEFNRLTPPAVILKLLASLAQSEAERERLQGEVLSAQAGESIQAGHLWNTYQASGQTKAMTFSGWINWNIIERGKAEAELAREREANQELRGRIKSAVEKLDDWNGDSRGFSASAAVTEAISLLEPRAKPVATTS